MSYLKPRGRWYITGVEKMKNMRFIATLMCLVLLAAACGKDDDSTSNSNNAGGSASVNEMATFSYLSTFIGRSDIEAVKTQFRDAGYVIEEDGESFDAQKITLTTTVNYRFGVGNSVITRACFWYGEDGLRTSGGLRSAVLQKIEEEKLFSANRTMESYHGYIYNGDSDQHSFTSREDFVDWFSTAELTNHLEGGSDCTYGTYMTTVDIFPDEWGIIIELR